ncbi:MAG: ParB/RepB/Spo0J family partition protein [Sphaerochaetaceae bacterium]|nr:ParB/RepB/Spo0J family partition protein [Sphaerochaetaceae bacterium]
MSANKKHGLGKGMESLLPDFDIEINTPTERKAKDTIEVEQLPISFIEPNLNQPRKDFDIESIKELSESIKNQGILQPLLVEKITDKKYVIIAGERRFRAAKMAGLQKIPVLVRTFSNTQRMEVSLIENIQRENLNPYEEALAYNYLLKEVSITQEELSKRLGKSRSTIANSVRLLQLPKQMLSSLKEGKLTSGHARALLSVINPADQQVLFDRILENNLSVRQTEKMAADLNQGKRIVTQHDGEFLKEKKKKYKELEILDIEEKFLLVVGTKVEIKGNLEKGKIEIPYTDQEELERIYQLLKPGSQLF